MSSKIGPVYLGTIEAVSRRLLLQMAGKDGHGLTIDKFFSENDRFNLFL